MNQITCPAQKIVDCYLGGANDVPPAWGPCKVLYSLRLGTYLDLVAFLDVDNGHMMMCFRCSDNVTDAQWLAMGPAAPDPMALDRQQVDDMDMATCSVTCSTQTVQDLAPLYATPGNLTFFHTINQQGEITKIAWAPANREVCGKFILTDPAPESEWLSTVPASVRVDALQYTVAA